MPLQPLELFLMLRRRTITLPIRRMIFMRPAHSRADPMLQGGTITLGNHASRPLSDRIRPDLVNRLHRREAGGTSCEPATLPARPLCVDRRSHGRSGAGVLGTVAT